jgi:hypothetical protein
MFCWTGLKTSQHQADFEVCWIPSLVAYTDNLFIIDDRLAYILFGHSVFPSCITNLERTESERKSFPFFCYAHKFPDYFQFSRFFRFTFWTSERFYDGILQHVLRFSTTNVIHIYVPNDNRARVEESEEKYAKRGRGHQKKLGE